MISAITESRNWTIKPESTFFTRNITEFDNFTDMLFSRGSRRYVYGKRYVRMSQNEPLPLKNNVSMAKQLPTAPSSAAKKLRNLTFTPQFRAEHFPNNLYVSGELLKV